MGFSTTVFVVSLVVGILVVLVLIWIPVLAWLRRRSRAVTEQLATGDRGRGRCPCSGEWLLPGSDGTRIPRGQEHRADRADPATVGISNPYRPFDRSSRRVDHRRAGGEGCTRIKRCRGRGPHHPRDRALSAKAQHKCIEALGGIADLIEMDTMPRPLFMISE